MDRVNLVPLQSAFSARKEYLAGAHDRLRQPDEERNTDDHSNHGGQFSERSRKRNVAETCRRHRRDCKVKGVDEAD